MNDNLLKIHRIMKHFLLLSTMLFAFLTGCAKEGNPSSDQNGQAENLLVSFRLESGEKTCHGVIDHSSRTVTFRGILYGESVTGVKVSLAEGATISPDPNTLLHMWPERQVFTVSDGTVSEEYTVILADYAEDQTLTSLVFGYAQPADWNFDLYYDKIDWSSLTHILLSFAYVNADGTLNSATLDKFITRLADRARANGVKPVISIRSGSGENFAKAVATADGRETLATNIVTYARQHDMDGIDIDYEEYSNLSDTENVRNLLDLFSRIRGKMGEDMFLACAINAGTWLDYGKEWASYFDYVSPMSYDALNGKETPQQHASYEKYVTDIERCHDYYGIPYSKLLGGVPFYGYSWDNLPGTDANMGIAFRSIMDYYRDKNPEAKNVDVMGQTLYNGQETIRRKCRYAKDKDLAGIMIWQLFQDSTVEDESLLRVVGEEMLD